MSLSPNPNNRQIPARRAKTKGTVTFAITVDNQSCNCPRHHSRLNPFRVCSELELSGRSPGLIISYFQGLSQQGMLPPFYKKSEVINPSKP
ncbi:MAG: hypothetical protein ACFCBU_18665 [Cyanophyceae cyanobacterium]